MNFSVGILQTLVKLVQVQILELITCSVTGTGMLEESTDIKWDQGFFFWVYWEMFSFLDEICTIFNKGWSLATVILKNFSDEFGIYDWCIYDYCHIFASNKYALKCHMSKLLDLHQWGK